MTFPLADRLARRRYTIRQGDPVAGTGGGRVRDPRQRAGQRLGRGRRSRGSHRSHRPARDYRAAGRRRPPPLHRRRPCICPPPSPCSKPCPPRPRRQWSCRLTSRRPTIPFPPRPPRCRRTGSNSVAFPPPSGPSRSRRQDATPTSTGRRPWCKSLVSGFDRCRTERRRHLHQGLLAPRSAERRPRRAQPVVAGPAEGSGHRDVQVLHTIDEVRADPLGWRRQRHPRQHRWEGLEGHDTLEPGQACEPRQ